MRRLIPFVFGSIGRRSQHDEQPSPGVSHREASWADSNTTMHGAPGDGPDSDVFRLQPPYLVAVPPGLKERLCGIPESLGQDGYAWDGNEEEWDDNPLVPIVNSTHPHRERLYSIPARERKRSIQIRTWSAAACIVVLAAMGWAWMWREEWTPHSRVEPWAKAKPQVAAKDEQPELNPCESSNPQTDLAASVDRSEGALGFSARKRPGPEQLLAFDSGIPIISSSDTMLAHDLLQVEDYAPSCMGTPEDEEEQVASSVWDFAQLDRNSSEGMSPIENEMEVLGIRGALRRKMGHWGESMLSRTGGRWGWRFTGVEELERIELSIASLNITHFKHENEAQTRH